jgi:hypothetical protein
MQWIQRPRAKEQQASPMRIGAVRVDVTLFMPIRMHFPA